MSVPLHVQLKRARVKDEMLRRARRGFSRLALLPDSDDDDDADDAQHDGGDVVRAALRATDAARVLVP